MAVAAAALAAPAPAPAAGLYGSTTLTTDYFWRGVSQTRDKLAFQGGIGYAFDSGPYLGAWASNVDFPVPGGHRSATEVDYNLGTTAPLAGDWNLDFGAMRYTYRGADAQAAPASTEYYVGAGNGTLEFKAWYSRTAATWYLESGVRLRFPKGGALRLHLGNYRFQGRGSYTDWSVEVRRWWSQHVYTSLGYVHSTLSADACTAIIGAPGLCGPRFVFTTGGEF